MSDTLRWPDEPPALRNDLVVLRQWGSQDRATIVEACNDEEVQRWTTVPSGYTGADADFFIDIGPALWAERAGVNFAVEEAAAAQEGNGRPVGSLSVVGLSADGTIAELGYWTAPWGRRRGLTTAAVDLLAGWLLDDVGVDAVELVIHADNHGSVQVARRAGFEPVDGPVETVRALPDDDHVVWRRS